MQIDLSIIIPTYNTHEYLVKLLQVLNNQMRDNIEVIVIDDNSDKKLNVSYPWLKYIYLGKNSGGASKPRNVGLDNAKGHYITFIDSDDMVTNNYIKKILKEMEKKTDIIFISWKDKKNTIIMDPKPYEWNCSVWSRVYKREIIENLRFDESLRKGEDLEFDEKVQYKTFTSVKDVIYIYNSGRQGSLLNG